MGGSLSRVLSRYIFLNFNMVHVHMLVEDDTLAMLDISKRMFIAANTFLIVSYNLVQSVLVITTVVLLLVLSSKSKPTTEMSRFNKREDSILSDELKTPLPPQPLWVKPNHSSPVPVSYY